MAVRSRLLAHFEGFAPQGQTLLFAVPQGRTAILKHYALQNATGATAVGALSIRRAGVNIRFARHELATEALRAEAALYVVLHPGDELVLAVSAPGTWRVLASGVLLVGAPV